MTITCSDKEVRALVHALENYLPELRVDASRTDLAASARELWDQERTLTALLERLKKG